METTTANRWQALNPPIYLISILPGIAVALLAGGQTFWLYGLTLATLAVALLQHAINVFNDLSDWRLGADVNKMDSWVRFHQLNMRVVAVHGAVSFLAGGFLGLYVLHLSDQYWILAIATPLVLLGYMYNSGKRPLSYDWTGEWVTGVCYGPGVFGCLWLVAGQGTDMIYILGSVAFAALSVALLLSHQPPQIETDRQAGKLSFAVRYGVDKTNATARILFVISFLCILAGLFMAGTSHLTQIIYALAGILITIIVFRLPPQPKVMLLGSTIAIAMAWMPVIALYILQTIEKAV